MDGAQMQTVETTAVGEIATRVSKTARPSARVSASFSPAEILWLNEVVSVFLCASMDRVRDLSNSAEFTRVARKIQAMRRSSNENAKARQQHAVAAAVQPCTNDIVTARRLNESIRREFIALIDAGLEEWEARQKICSSRRIDRKLLSEALRPHRVNATRARLAKGKPGA